MANLIEIEHLSKRYGKLRALDDVSLRVGAGRIVGLIGRNGAGKTTLLKAILGLTPYQGSVRVFGLEADRDRSALMSEICFIADTGVLPRWLRVDHAIDYVEGVHPRFNRQRAEEVLLGTQIPRRARIGELSKGMITQLHLALILAIDARLLVLDEPTLGLDLLYRRQFFDTLLNDYLDHERTILLATHQLEEVEHLLTDVLLIDEGRVALDTAIEELPQRFVQLSVAAGKGDAARALHPIYTREVLGRPVMLFENQPREALAGLGEVSTPRIADLFVAKLSATREPRPAPLPVGAVA
ncbi:MAG TPA: ABC transporter ATP-binding protein [Steroidobacteraceae bacterium]|nr:ABC transporter ATP-binding protein [Steroidobacteraceae bacterium]